MSEGTEKNEILNERPLDFFKKAMSGYSYLKEKGFLVDSSLENLIAEDLVEGEEQMKNGLEEESLSSFKRAINRMEIMAENNGIEIDYYDMQYMPSEEEQSFEEKAENISSDNLESKQPQDEVEIENEVPEAPEPEPEIFELKDRDEESELEKDDLFSIFEDLEKKLGALNIDAAKKQEIQTFLDAANDTILQNNEEDANAFLAMAEAEINKFSIAREEVELEEEIENISEEEEKEDFDAQGVPLPYSEYSEERTPEAEEEADEIAEIKIEEPEIRPDESNDKTDKEELLKYKEYTTAVGFVNSKFLDFFEQEKYINPEEKEKVAILLECAYDALKEAEDALDEEEKITRYEEALEDANMADARMDKVLKESGEKERGKVRFSQIVRLSEIQKSERRKYFTKKKEEDRIRAPKRRSKLENILGKAGILTVDEEDELKRKKAVITPEIRKSLKNVERYEKEATPVYERLKENESAYFVSEDDFGEFKQLAFNILRENSRIVDLTNKEEEKKWEKMASNKKIVEDGMPSVDIKETGDNVFYYGKDTKKIKYLEKVKEPKLPSSFERAYKKAEYELDENLSKKAKTQSPLNGSMNLLKKDKRHNNIIITDENAKNFE